MGNEMEKKNVRILLISDSRDSMAEIGTKLLQATGFSCCVWHCSGLADSIEALEDLDPDIDVVLVDFDLINTGRPREIFQRMMGAIDALPIIVFNGSIEHDLALFIIAEGATDSLTKDQVNAETFSLEEVIERCMVRAQITRKMQRKNTEEVERIKKQWKSDLAQANGNGSYALKKAEEKNAQKLREKDQVIHWMSGGYSVEK